MARNLSPCGGPGAWKRGCRCDICRAWQRDRMRAYYARRRAEGRPIPRGAVPSVCEACGQDYMARADSVKAGRARFCSARCRNLFNIGVDPNAAPAPRPPRKSPIRRAAEKRAAKAAAGSTGGNRVWVQGACLVCGDDFCSPGLESRYCSLDCRMVARSTAKWIDYATRLSIYREASWTCQVCERETLRRYVRGNPLSPTLDHIVPRARGGSDDRSNLRLLCSACNSMRGDLTHYSDAEVRALVLAA